MSTLAQPELTVELVTVIIRHAQDLEHDEHTQPLFTGTCTTEVPPDTLARIRSLLRKGLVSKIWQGAIMDPTLWTSFLNANLHEDQFLRVVARSGDLPVGIWFKSPRAANNREGVNTSDNSSDRMLKAIRENLPRIMRLAIDLSGARIESHKDANLQMLRLLTSSIPNLHALSLTGSSGQVLDVTPAATSAPIFGGEEARIQHLELMDFILPPRAFAHTIVSLSIGFNAVTKLMEVLPPWIEHIRQGDIPGLRDLAICGPTSEANTNRYVYPWDDEIPPVKIPSTIESTLKL